MCTSLTMACHFESNCAESMSMFPISDPIKSYFSPSIVVHIYLISIFINHSAHTHIETQCVENSLIWSRAEHLTKPKAAWPQVCFNHYGKFSLANAKNYNNLIHLVQSFSAKGIVTWGCFVKWRKIKNKKK